MGQKTDIVVKMIFGAHLYGTATETSDTDYKGIFMPSAHQILTCSVPRTQIITSGPGHQKNSPTDVDDDLYSLPYFLTLAGEGETVALDMLHAPTSAILQTSATWQHLVTHRTKFYTKNLNAFVGYARRQAAKYGIKGSRLEAVRKALAFLKRQPDTTRLTDVWDDLWEDEYCKKLESGEDQMWEVCGKKLTGRAVCTHYIPMLQRFLDQFGERARQAERNEGVDWKAVSHAFRAGYQALHILKDGGFSYPLPETDFLRQVKQGTLHYQNEVARKLDDLMEELERLSEASTLPVEPDRTWINQFLYDTLYDHIQQETTGDPR